MSDIYCRMLRIILVFLLATRFAGAAGAVADTVVTWHPVWHTLSEGKLMIEPNWHKRTLGYFAPPSAPHARLLIHSRGPFTLWVNQIQISSAVNDVTLSLDSLRAQFDGEWWLGVHSRERLADVWMTLQLPADQITRPFLEPLPSHEVANFVIMVSLVLIAVGIRLWRGSPTLFYAYFNIFRLVSTRERDETQRMRITSSQNILFYFFLGAWLAFLVVLLFATDPTASLPLFFPTTRFIGLLLNWLLLTTFVVILIFSKYALQTFFSRIYAVFDQSPDQFFTFVRVCFLVAALLTIWLLGSYFLGISMPSSYAIAVLVLLGSSLLSIAFMQIRFLKGTPFRLFHIFSYLCLTEVIPLVITFRLLYY